MKTRRTFSILLSAMLLLGFDALAFVAQHKSARKKKASASEKRGFLAPSQNRSSDGVWLKVEKHSVRLSLLEFESAASKDFQSYQTFTLNPESLKRKLQSASAASNAARRSAAPRINAAGSSTAAVLTVPMPNGTFPEFSIQESSIMAPELAAKYPDIKTYVGQGLADKSATLRLDYSPVGLHAMVLSSTGSFYVDPLRKGDNRTHIAYASGARRQDREPFRCLVNEDMATGARPRDALHEAKTFSAGGVLRTYRLAVAATGEYTRFQGGTVSDSLRAIVTTVNRVVGIYTRELGISMVLVAQEDQIIYPDPDSDPYTNTDDLKLLNENQANLDAVIGRANFDIGHVLGTGGGGRAGVGVVCVDGRKAAGETGSRNPTGDGFNVDYVAHEMGHQFGANHTFNSVTSSCGGNRYPGTAYEPGSGSTIMAYAGICGGEDLQPHTDDYFHLISLLEIVNYVTTIVGGPQPIPVNNLPPVVAAGTDLTVPRGTPFTLTATGGDPDGDDITFCWEQFDLGEAAPPDTDEDGNRRPIFRSFAPASTPFRMFPRLQSILSNRPTLGEAYSSTDREMSFRVTARDNHPVAGAFSYDSVKIAVSASTGPFAIRAPNTELDWPAGTNQTVTWDVAGSSGPPVNCSMVKIVLSTDGGVTFPILLRTNTPNDGSEVVVVPNVGTFAARIKVEATDNIFFDISDANFTITTNAPVARPAIIGGKLRNSIRRTRLSGDLRSKDARNRHRIDG